MTNRGTRISNSLAKFSTIGALAALLAMPALGWEVKNAKDNLDALTFSRPELRVTQTPADAETIASLVPNMKALDLFRSENGTAWHFVMDQRTGRLNLLDGGAIPFIPGEANSLRAEDFGASCRNASCVAVGRVETLAREFLNRYSDLFQVDPNEFELDPLGSVPVGNTMYFLRFQWKYAGIPVEGGSISFRINNGNLIQVAIANIGPIHLDPNPVISADYAREILRGYLGKDTSNQDEVLDKGSLAILPITPRGQAPEIFSGAYGQQIDYVLVYNLVFSRPEVDGTWEATVDAHTGELLRFVDSNRYGRIHGGIRPSDGLPPEEDHPFPGADIDNGVRNAFTDSSGNFAGNSATTQLKGQYCKINDSCGAISASTTSGDIDFGMGATGTDCTVPTGNTYGPGNTKPSRTIFWNVSALNVRAQVWNPANTWLMNKANACTVNVNQAPQCNASAGGGIINFYKKATGCNNLGEIPGVAMHEWGHLYDTNDGSGQQDKPVETYADFIAIMSTHNSCLGAAFLTSGNCGGYGNPCTACTGVRDIDYKKHNPATPWTSSNNGSVYSCSSGSYNGPCGWEDHCESGIAAQALWDLSTLDLLAPPTSMDADSAWALMDRLWFTGVITMDDFYTCAAAVTSGCTGNTAYNVLRAVDDTGDGTGNGTPHATAIFAALNRHKLVCGAAGDATNQNQTTCPTLTITTLSGIASNNRVDLSWPTVNNATRYWIFRNEGTCSAGFTRIATVNAPTLTYADTAVANGTTYNYRFQAVTASDACTSSISNCLSVSPVAGPSAVYLGGSAALGSPVGGDGDAYLDNCEGAPVSFQVYNDGNANLTNVRATITSSTPSVTITTTMPVNLGALAVGGTVTGSFNIELGTGGTAAACGEMLSFSISVTSDQQSPGNTSARFNLGPVEQDTSFQASRTDSFETGMDGWSGNFTRDNSRAASGSWSLHSSSGANGACDAAYSPVVGAISSSSVVIAVRYDIEPTSGGQVWDKANVHAIDTATGIHYLLTPTGRTYNVTKASGDTLCHITNDAGWNGTITAFADATFNLSPFSGKSIQIEVNYNTDGASALTGIWFDNVRWSNINTDVCDTQGDTCASCTPPNPPNLTSPTAGCSGVALAWNSVSGAASYNVYRGAATGGPYTKLGGMPVTSTSYTDSTAVVGTTYYYVVRAACDAGGTVESANSNERSTVAIGTPAAPTGVSATGNCTVVNVSWSASSGATSYDVMRGTACGTAVTTFAGVTSPYSDTSAVAGTAYQYWVVAKNSCGTSANSSCASGTRTAVPTAPAIPTFSSVSCASLTVSWSAVNGATSYDVYRASGSTCSGATKLGNTTGTSYPDLGLLGNTQYSYYIVAKNICGDSANGACGTTTTTVCAPNIVYSTNSSWAVVSGMGNTDAVLDPGESWDVAVALANTGAVPATNVVASLTAAGATFCMGTASFGTILAGNSATATFRFTIDQAFTCGNNLSFNVVNKGSSEGSYANENGAFTKQVGAAGTGTPEIGTAANFTAPKSGTSTATLAPDFTIIGAAAQSASATFTANNQFSKVTAALLRCVNTGNTVVLSLPTGNGIPATTDVTTFYQSNGAGTYRIEWTIGNQNVNLASISMTVTPSASPVCNTWTGANCIPSIPPETAPGDTLDTAQKWTDKNTQTWPTVTGAQTYNIYFGLLADLPALTNSAADSCLHSNVATNSDATLSEDPTGKVGGFFWYLITAANGAGEGTAGPYNLTGTPTARVVNLKAAGCSL